MLYQCNTQFNNQPSIGKAYLLKHTRNEETNERMRVRRQDKRQSTMNAVTNLHGQYDWIRDHKAMEVCTVSTRYWPGHYFCDQMGHFSGKLDAIRLVDYSKAL